MLLSPELSGHGINHPAAYAVRLAQPVNKSETPTERMPFMPVCQLARAELFYADKGLGEPLLFLNGLSGDHLYWTGQYARSVAAHSLSGLDRCRRRQLRLAASVTPGNSRRAFRTPGWPFCRGWDMPRLWRIRRNSMHCWESFSPHRVRASGGRRKSGLMMFPTMSPSAKMEESQSKRTGTLVPG